MKTLALLATTGLLSLAACSAGGNTDDQLGPNPTLPDVKQYLVPPMHVASVEPWKNGAMPTVAAGLQVNAFASDFHNVRSVYPLPNGDVLAVEAKPPEEPVGRPKDIVVGFIQGFGHSKVKSESRVILLRDADGDGKAETRSVLIDHLNAPFGVALVGGDLYVANTDSILRYPYETGQTRITAKPTLLTELPGGPINHHWTKSLVASPDGSKLYVGIGSNSNITENGIEAETDRARIWEVDRTTGAHRPFATGLRNPNGLSFEPTTDTLWTVVNERDELGPDLVPDYMTSVKDGAFYGWPYSYYGQHVDPRVRPMRPDLVLRAMAPDYALSSHVAPLGMAFTSTASAMPSQFRGGAFVSEHGSWNRGRLNGYKVVYIPFANGRPSGKPADIVTGFIKNGKAQGRPVGVAIDSRGALLIADDAANVVWRVTTK